MRGLSGDEPILPHSKRFSSNERRKSTIFPVVPMSQRHQREDDYMPTSFTRKIPFHSVRLAANNSYISPSSVSHFNDSRPRVSLSRFHQEDAVLQAVTLGCNTNNEQLSHPRIGLRSVRTLLRPSEVGSLTPIAYGDWTQGLHCLLLTVILTDPWSHSYPK